MHPWIKRTALVGVAMTAALAVAATSLSVSEVNARVAKLLEPFNNETTSASIGFSDLVVNNERVLKFGVESFFRKIGPQNEVELQLPKITYAYEGPRGVPHFNGQVALALDLLKAFPRSYLDDLAGGVEEFITDTVKSLTEAYGEAVTVDAKVDDLVRDADGHVQSLKLHIDFQLDLSKLPATVKIEDVYLTRARAEVAVHLRGGEIQLNGDVNPKHTSFQSGQMGLKELVDGLLNNNPETYKKLQGFVEWVTKMAEQLVNQKPEA